MRIKALESQAMRVLTKINYICHLSNGAKHTREAIMLWTDLTSKDSRNSPKIVNSNWGASVCALTAAAAIAIAMAVCDQEHCHPHSIKTVGQNIICGWHFRTKAYWAMAVILATSTPNQSGKIWVSLKAKKSSCAIWNQCSWPSGRSCRRTASILELSYWSALEYQISKRGGW